MRKLLFSTLFSFFAIAPVSAGTIFEHGNNKDVSVPQKIGPGISVTQFDTSETHMDVQPHDLDIVTRWKFPDEDLPFEIDELSLANSIGTLTASASGRGRNQQNWSCTAFCAADDLIATSAHCLSKAKGNGLPTMRSTIFRVRTLFPSRKKPIRIMKGMDQATPLKGVDDRNPHLALYSGHEFKKYALASVENDWAFAKLQHPICKNRALPFRAMNDDELFDASDEGRVSMISYPLKGLRTQATIDRSCKLLPLSSNKAPPYLRRTLGRNKPVLLHDCKSAPGSSGAPILAHTDGGTVVVAINSGEISLKQWQITTKIRKGKRIKQRVEISSRTYKSAVRPDAIIEGIYRFKNERLLNSLKEFKEVQLILKKLRLYRGEIDGLLGPMTKRAIMRYEKKVNLVPIGLPTQRFMNLLRSEHASLKAAGLRNN